MESGEQEKKDIHDIKNTLTRLNLRLEIVYNCLVGNEISKDGGLVADIYSIKSELGFIVKRVETMEKSERQRGVYVKIIWGVAGVAAALIANHFLKF